jgi:hypothetical protein
MSEVQALKYRRNAAACKVLAQQTNLPAQKANWLMLAAEWNRLADAALLGVSDVLEPPICEIPCKFPVCREDGHSRARSPLRRQQPVRDLENFLLMR